MLESHEVGGGQAAFKPRKREQSKLGTPLGCTSHFLMSDAAVESRLVLENDAHEGDIICPKCSARIGSFNWSGSQCSCGAWVTPAVQITKSKVDESLATLPVPQMPRGGAVVRAPLLAPLS